MKKFLLFQSMITPTLIQFIFWIGVIATIAMGILDIAIKHHILNGLQMIILGPLALRVAAEILIVFFRICQNLDRIRHAVEQPPTDNENH
jgi:hypothetical protein